MKFSYFIFLLLSAILSIKSDDIIEITEQGTSIFFTSTGSHPFKLPLASYNPNEENVISLDLEKDAKNYLRNVICKQVLIEGEVTEEKLREKLPTSEKENECPNQYSTQSDNYLHIFFRKTKNPTPSETAILLLVVNIKTQETVEKQTFRVFISPKMKEYELKNDGKESFNINLQSFTPIYIKLNLNQLNLEDKVFAVFTKEQKIQKIFIGNLISEDSVSVNPEFYSTQLFKGDSQMLSKTKLLIIELMTDINSKKVVIETELFKNKSLDYYYQNKTVFNIRMDNCKNSKYLLINNNLYNNNKKYIHKDELISSNFKISYKNTFDSIPTIESIQSQSDSFIYIENDLYQIDTDLFALKLNCTNPGIFTLYLIDTETQTTLQKDMRNLIVTKEKETFDFNIKKVNYETQEFKLNIMESEPTGFMGEAVDTSAFQCDKCLGFNLDNLKCGGAYFFQECNVKVNTEKQNIVYLDLVFNNPTQIKEGMTNLKYKEISILLDPKKNFNDVKIILNSLKNDFYYEFLWTYCESQDNCYFIPPYPQEKGDINYVDHDLLSKNQYALIFNNPYRGKSEINEKQKLYYLSISFIGNEQNINYDLSINYHLVNTALRTLKLIVFWTVASVVAVIILALGLIFICRRKKQLASSDINKENDVRPLNISQDEQDLTLN